MTEALRRPPVRLTGQQALVVAGGFAATPYRLHALAIMPDHAHMVIGRTSRHIRQVVGHLKSTATRALREHGWFADASPWTHHGWNVYLDSEPDVQRAVRYVEENPVRSGLQRQRWSCVVPFDPVEARRKRRR